MNSTLNGFIRRLGLLHLLSFVFLLIVLSTVIQDRLLFKSDKLTLSFFLFSLNGILLLILLPAACLIFRFFRARPQRLRVWYVQTITFMVLYSIIMNVLNNPFVFKSQTSWQLLAVNGVSMILAAVISKKISDSSVFLRIIPISRWFLAFGLLVLVGAKILMSLQTPAAPRQRPKNVILFVMDSLSTEVIREYNPAAAAAAADIAAGAFLFENIRTNYTYTYGYFDALFHGRKSPAAPGRQNLISLLQKNGVRTRWLAAQGNAVPDNHAVKNYRGLRSYFFNYRFSALLNGLGIEYNVYRVPFRKDGPAIYAAHQIIDLVCGRKRDFAADVQREIVRLRNDGRPFFFLIHQFPACETAFPNALWESAPAQGMRERITENIKNHDFVYTPAEKWLVDEWQAKALADVRAGFTCLQSIQKFLSARGWTADTWLVLTADHGKTFKDNKVWYGFHNGEDVARVPLLLFNSGRPGRDAGLGETIDITQTLLDHFVPGQQLDAHASSLLNRRSKNSATTLCEYSPVRREQFFNLYKQTDSGIRKYVVDIAKRNEYSEFALATDGEIFLGKKAWVDNQWRDEFRAALGAYGLPWKK